MDNHQDPFTAPIDDARLRSGVIIAIGISVFGFLATLAFNLGLARLLPPAEYGSYKVAEAVINVSGVVCLLGGAAGAMRFIPKMLAEHQMNRIWQYIRFYARTAVYLSIALFALHSVLILLNLDDFNEESLHPVYWAWLVVPFAAMAALFGAILLAARCLRMGYIPWKIANPLLKLSLVYAFVALNGSMTAVEAIWLTLLASAVISVFLAVEVFRRKLVHFNTQGIQHNNIQKWLAVSIPIMIGIALQKLVKQIDLYMLEIYSAEDNVGYFAAAVTVVNIVYLVQIAVGGLINPYMRSAIIDGRQAVHDLNQRGIRQLFIQTLPISIGIGLFGSPLLQLFGYGYDAAYEALLILIPGYWISTVLMLPVNWLQYSDRQRLVMFALAAAVALNVVLNIILIPMYDVNGAALATTISMVCVSAYLSWEMWRKMRVRPI